MRGKDVQNKRGRRKHIRERGRGMGMWRDREGCREEKEDGGERERKVVREGVLRDEKEEWEYGETVKSGGVPKYIRR